MLPAGNGCWLVLCAHLYSTEHLGSLEAVGPSKGLCLGLYAYTHAHFTPSEHQSKPFNGILIDLEQSNNHSLL